MRDFEKRGGNGWLSDEAPAPSLLFLLTMMAEEIKAAVIIEREICAGTAHSMSAGIGEEIAAAIRARRSSS